MFGPPQRSFWWRVQIRARCSRLLHEVIKTTITSIMTIILTSIMTIILTSITTIILTYTVSWAL
jgi:hypothetical protein